MLLRKIPGQLNTGVGGIGRQGRGWCLSSIVELEARMKFIFCSLIQNDNLHLLSSDIHIAFFVFDLSIHERVNQLLFYSAKNSLLERTRSSLHGSNNFPAANIDIPSAQSGYVNGI